MSNVKKILSVLLAVAMVLTCAPLTAFADLSPDAVHADPELDYSTTAPTQFYVDTSETAEVVRVASDNNSYVIGTKIVAATPSGIPAGNGSFNSLPINGETAAYGNVVFKVYGATPTSVNVVSNCNASVGTSNASTSGGVYTWTAPINDSGSGGVPVGTDIVWTITYEVAGTTYVAYAYSHVESILVASGCLVVKEDKNTTHSNVRQSWAFQILGKNVYAGGAVSASNTSFGYFAGSGGNGKGYLNYYSTNYGDGSDLAGCGTSGWGDSTAFGVGSSTTGQGNTARGENSSYNDHYLCMGDNDGNRAIATVCIDKSVTTNLNQLNFRALAVLADTPATSAAGFSLLRFYTSQVSGVNVNGNSVNPAASTASTAVWNGSATPSTESLSSRGQYYNVKFTGTGPTSLGYYWYSMCISSKARNGNNSTNRHAGYFQNVNFDVYNKGELRNLVKTIMMGTRGSNWTGTSAISGTTATVNPKTKAVNTYSQSQLEAQTAFVTALQNAGKALAQPDLYTHKGSSTSSQAYIQSVTQALINAYNALPNYVNEVEVTVQHVTGSEMTPITTTASPYNCYLGDTVTPHALEESPGYRLSANLAAVTLSSENCSWNSTTNKWEYTFTFIYNPVSVNIRYYCNDDSNNVGIESVEYNSSYQLYTDPSDYTTSTLPYHTKAYYTFDGWFTDRALTQRVAVDASGNYAMTGAVEQRTFYGAWTTTPLNIYVDSTSVTGGTVTKIGTVKPDANNPVAFAKPAADPSVSGYLFVDYFMDPEFTNPVTWPLTFNVGDSDLTLYARFVDVNGKIVFETNGGTTLESYSYNIGDTVTASDVGTTTRVGYNFGGWYRDVELTQPAFPATMSSATGFIAYAKWTPKTVVIRFDTQVGSRPTAYDTVSIPQRVGEAGSLIDPEDYPPEPQRFGWIFTGWSDADYNTFEFKEGATYPVTDGDLDRQGNPTTTEEGYPVYTLKANWVSTKYSAFIRLNAYEKLSGEYVELVDPDNTAEKGDIITVRMTTKTNFYTGSSLFVIMYDKTFFDLVGSGTNAITLNPDNDYIKGIDAQASVVDNIPNTTFANGTTRWPAGYSTSQYAAIQVALDPNYEGGYVNTVQTSDDTWMIELQLKVREDASGSGAVIVDKAWTRNADNPMGTMFYGYTERQESVLNTRNNVVTPNTTMGTAIVNLDPETTPDTTITANAVNGDLAGAWSDGAASKTFTGKAETEIMTINGTTVTYYEEPTLSGYHLDETTPWVNANDATDTWASGYYGKEAQDGNTYVAQWVPNQYDVTFYQYTPAMLTALGVSQVTVNASQQDYATTVTAPADPTLSGYTFLGWADASMLDATTVPGVTLAETNEEGVQIGNTLDFANNAPTVLNPETATTPEPNVFYAVWVPAKIAYKIGYTQPATPTTFRDLALKDSSGAAIAGYAGYQVQIVTALPAEIGTTYTFTGNTSGTGSAQQTFDIVLDKDNHIYYILDDANGALRKVGNYEYSRDANTLPITATIAGDGSTQIFVNYVGATVEVYFNANGGTFVEDASIADKLSEDCTVYTATGRFGDVINEAYVLDPAHVTRTGYDVTVDENGYVVWARGSSVYDPLGENPTTYPTPVGAATARTYRASWTAKKVPVTFVITADPVDGTRRTASLLVNGENPAYDSTITVPAEIQPYTDATYLNAAGKVFSGWSLTDGGAVVESLGTVNSETGITFYAVFADKDYNINYNIIKNQGLANEETLTLPGATAHMGDQITLPADQSTTGYTFDGWYAGSDTTQLPAGSGYMVGTADVTFNGYLNPKTITNIFNYNYGTAPDAASQPADATVDSTFDQAIQIPTDPTRDGYTFEGWATSASATSGSTDLGNQTTETAATYYAVWSANTVNYIVEIYKENPNWTTEAERYTKDDSLTETLSGVVHTTVTYDPATIANYETPDSVSDVIPASGTLTLQVYYNLVTVTLTLDPNGGALPATQPATVDYRYGQTVATPEEPTLEGYTFNGWTNLPTTITANTTAVASWNVNAYPVVFNADGAEVSRSNLNYGTVITPPQDQTKTGYTFQGWKVAGTADSEIVTFSSTAPTVPVDGVTYEAVFTINSYKLQYMDANNGILVEVDVPYNATIKESGAIVAAYATAQEPTPPTGQQFDGWNVAALPATMPASNQPVRPMFSNISYTLTLYGNDGTIDGQSSYTRTPIYYGEATNIDSRDLYREGYSFNGWYDAATGGNEVTAYATMPAENLTLYARWSVNQYTIIASGAGGTFTVGDETNLSTKTYTQDFGSAVTAPTDVTREGYTFRGWEDANSGDDFTWPATMPVYDGEKEVRAKWQINQYSIQYVDGVSGDVIFTITQNYNTLITNAPETPEDVGYDKPGYTFQGWSAITPDLMPATENETRTLVITANYTINTYTIRFVDSDAFDNAAITSITDEFGATVNAPEDPTKEGYTFTGWNTTIPATMPANDLTIKATWQIRQYTIQFVDADAFGNTVLATLTQDYGSTVNAPALPEHAGYTCNGWDQTVPSTMPALEDGEGNAQTLVIKAVYETNDVTITFDANEGENAPQAITQPYGSTVTAPATEPTREGYTFQYWYLSTDATEAEYSFTTMPAENITLKAKWSVNTYSIYFNDLEDGARIGEITKNYGLAIEASEVPVPTRDGYTFSGTWYEAQAGDSDPVFTVPATMQAFGDGQNNGYVIVYADWTTNTYYVTFYDADGNVIGTPQAYTVENVYADVAVPADQTLEYYNFEGWSNTRDTDLNDANIPEAFDFTANAANNLPSGGVSFYPVFTRVVVTLKLVAESTAAVTPIDNMDGVNGYITGIPTRQRQARVYNPEAPAGTYLGVEGNGHLEFDYKTDATQKYQLVGTGTQVDVVDNVTGEVVETYYVVIYGDVNGDSDISSVDNGMMKTEVAGTTQWSQPVIDEETQQPVSNDYYWKLLAGDLNGNGVIVNDTADSSALATVVMRYATINQAAATPAERVVANA